ncbi:MAG TPA: hypothetical protein VLG40_01220 [Candidatus Saccharimonas sp.]|nr:hypothetical protein [Candidatus Saccharimonas sp.]
MPIRVRALIIASPTETKAVDIDVVHLNEGSLAELLRHTTDDTESIIALEAAVPAHVPATMQGWGSEPCYDWMITADGVSLAVQVTSEHRLPQAIEKVVKSIRNHLHDLSHGARYDLDHLVQASLAQATNS